MRKIIDDHLTDITKPASPTKKRALWENFHDFRLTVVRRNALRSCSLLFGTRRRKVGRRASDLL